MDAAALLVAASVCNVIAAAFMTRAAVNLIRAIKLMRAAE